MKNEKLDSVLAYVRTNLWTLATIAISVMMVVVIGRNFVHAVSIGFEIGKMEREKAKYQRLVTRDSTLLESLSCDDVLEKYAREKFYMQGKKEEIFIVE